MFGCCSRFKECSRKRECVSPFPEMKADCHYKTQLEKGFNYLGDKNEDEGIESFKFVEVQKNEFSEGFKFEKKQAKIGKVLIEYEQMCLA